MDLSVEHPAVPHARTLARSTLIQEHWHATHAIGELGVGAGKEGGGALARTVVGEGFQGSIRWKAAESLGLVGEAAGLDGATSLAHVILHKKPGEPGSDVFVRSGAAGALGKLGDAASLAGVEALAEALRIDVSEQVRRRAVISLGELGASAAGENGQAALSRALRWDADDVVRFRCGEALAIYGTKVNAAAAASLLLTLAKDPIPAVRERSATALGSMGPSATEAHIAGLHKARDSDERDSVRSAAIAAQDTMRGLCIEAISPICASHEFVRGNAAKMLGELQAHVGEDAGEALAVALLKDETYVRRRVSESLLRLGPIAPEICAAAAMWAIEDDPDAFVQWTCSQFVEAYGPERAKAAAENAKLLRHLAALLDAADRLVAETLLRVGADSELGRRLEALMSWGGTSKKRQERLAEEARLAQEAAEEERRRQEEERLRGPPAAPPRRRGGGDDEDEEVAAMLKQYNIQKSDLPKGALDLPTDKLCRFIKSYANGLNRFLIKTWPAWRDKMLADPEFAYKIAVEETVGLGLAMSGTVAARGKDILNELDFFLTDCAVGAVLNFVLIWLLAPTVAAKAGPGPFAAQLSKLPAFVFESGQFTLGQRAGAGLYKGSLFGACGFLGSVGGTSLAYMIFMARQAAAGGEAKKKELPNVMANSLGWASFMFVSTNPRYQVVNAVEQAIYKTSASWGRALSLVLRTGNNIIGGATWVMWARFIGLQKKEDKGPAKQKQK